MAVSNSPSLSASILSSPSTSVSAAALPIDCERDWQRDWTNKDGYVGFQSTFMVTQPAESGGVACSWYAGESCYQPECDRTCSFCLNTCSDTASIRRACTSMCDHFISIDETELCVGNCEIEKKSTCIANCHPPTVCPPPQSNPRPVASDSPSLSTSVSSSKTTVYDQVY
jgi:hypothetical protein